MLPSGSEATTTTTTVNSGIIVLPRAVPMAAWVQVPPIGARCLVVHPSLTAHHAETKAVLSQTWDPRCVLAKRARVCVLGFVVPADRAGVPARAGQARHFLGGGEGPCSRRRAVGGVYTFESKLS